MCGSALLVVDLAKVARTFQELDVLSKSSVKEMSRSELVRTANWSVLWFHSQNRVDRKRKEREAPPAELRVQSKETRMRCHQQGKRKQCRIDRRPKDSKALP